MTLRVWNDNRSGLLGCMAGNLVLSQIAQEKGLRRDEIAHEKGTIFSMPDSVIVGRICTSDKYLQKDVAHFCNMSASQTDAISHYNGKQAFFLFITISTTTIHYWLVPGNVVEDVMKSLKPKPSSPTCFVRIYNKGGRFFLGTKDVSQYHKTMPMKGRKANRLIRAAESAVTNAQPSDNGKSIPLSFEIDGVRYEGTVAPRNGRKDTVTV